MAGLLDWVDPTRNAFVGLLRGEDRAGIRNKLAEALMNAPKPFDRSAIDGPAMVSNALSVGGLLGIAGKMPKPTPEAASKMVDAFRQYNQMASKELQTPQDLLYFMDNLPDLQGIPKGVQSVANKYRRAVSDDFSVYAGRGDVEPYEEAFIAALERFSNKVK